MSARQWSDDAVTQCPAAEWPDRRVAAAVAAAAPASGTSCPPRSSSAPPGLIPAARKQPGHSARRWKRNITDSANCVRLWFKVWIFGGYVDPSPSSCSDPPISPLATYLVGLLCPAPNRRRIKRCFVWRLTSVCLASVGLSDCQTRTSDLTREPRGLERRVTCVTPVPILIFLGLCSLFYGN